jgi:hypothetical protein
VLLYFLNIYQKENKRNKLEKRKGNNSRAENMIFCSYVTPQTLFRIFYAFESMRELGPEVTLTILNGI